MADFSQSELNFISRTVKKETTDSGEGIADIKGLNYLPNFITQLEHDLLLKQIDSQPWLSEPV
jgi:hypothetical protein